MVTSGRTSHCGAHNLRSVRSTVRQQSFDVSIAITQFWQCTSLHCTHSLVFCRLTPCIRTCVVVRSYRTLYHVDFIGQRDGGDVLPHRCLLCISILEKGFDSTANLVQKVTDVLIVGITAAPQRQKRYLKGWSRSLERKAWGLLGLNIHWEGHPVRLSYSIVSSILPTGRRVPAHRQPSSLPLA